MIWGTARVENPHFMYEKRGCVRVKGPLEPLAFHSVLLHTHSLSGQSVWTARLAHLPGSPDDQSDIVQYGYCTSEGDLLWVLLE